MKEKLYGFYVSLGPLVYYLITPIRWIFLSHTHRGYALIIYDSRILLVKNWLGNGSWSLPGGGIHGWERAEAGVVREIHEETGISVTSLEYLGEGFRKDKVGGRHYLIYYIVLDNKPDVRLRKREVTSHEWVPITSVKAFGKLAPIVETALARYEARDTV